MKIALNLQALKAIPEKSPDLLGVILKEGKV
jgi:hypothetical protein